MGTKIKYEWKKTKYSGVRFREHLTRKHGIKPDCYFVIRYQRDGKRKEEGLGWASEGWSAEKAALQLAELKKAYTTGEGPSRLAHKRDLEKERLQAEQEEKERQERENVTFKRYFEETYKVISQGNKKYSSYQRELQHFNIWIEPGIGALPFKGISPFHIEKIKKNMNEAEMSPRSIQYVLATVRQVWNSARRNGLVESESPTKQVKIPKMDNKRLRFLTREEAESLLENLKNRSTQLHDLALVSLQCGLRAGEIFGLTWGDVDLKRGTLTLRNTKGGKNRVAFMTGQVKEMLGSMVRGKHDDFVFPDRNGQKIMRISKSFERAVDELKFNEGISDPRQWVVFHTLRHTFASWLVENGTDLYTVKELLGHASLTMTERYSHLGQNTLQTAVRNLEKSLSNEKKKKSISDINLKLF